MVWLCFSLLYVRRLAQTSPYIHTTKNNTSVVYGPQSGMCVCKLCFSIHKSQPSCEFYTTSDLKSQPPIMKITLMFLETLLSDLRNYYAI